jgi:hypothetical protein
MASITTGISACAGKASYPTRDDARIALISIGKSPRFALGGYKLTGKLPRRVYRCDCGNWHLTHCLRRAPGFRTPPA